MLNKLQTLYDNGVMFTVETYPDIGFTCYLGDRFNGISNYKSFETFDEGVEWLWTEALKKSTTLQEFVNKNL